MVSKHQKKKMKTKETWLETIGNDLEICYLTEEIALTAGNGVIDFYN